MEPLSDPISELVHMMMENNYNTDFTCWVHVTHINHPHSFYVRPTAYKKYLEHIAVRGDKLNIQNIMPGTKVVYFSNKKKKFIRGIVMHIVTDDEQTEERQNVFGAAVKLFAMDYGFPEICNSEKIYKSEVNIAPLAKHCKLADAMPIGSTEWNSESIDAMKEYVGKERAKLIVRSQESDKIIVELINSTPDTIAILMALTGYSHLGYDQNTAHRSTNNSTVKHQYNFKKVKEGDKMFVRVLPESPSVNGLYYLSEVTDYAQLNGMKEMMLYQCKENPEIEEKDMVVNQAVAVKSQYGKGYERGLITEVNKTLKDNKAKVLLVDVGTTIEVGQFHLKLLRERFMSFTPASMFCLIENNNNPNLNYFSGEILIQFKKIGNGTTVPHIVHRI